MSNIFFTSDTHFSHKRICEYCNRPFSSVEEMNEVMIRNWNKVVKKNDIVWHLGDLAFGNFNKISSIIERLNGKIYLIKGSHDKLTDAQYHKILNKKWNTTVSNYVYLLKVIKLDNNYITLCHYAMRTWHKSHYNTWHLFGHSHGKLEGLGKSFDVGVDTSYLGHKKFIPYYYEEIKEIMKTRPDNFNYIRKWG